jgi:hypothetical protein
MKCLGSLFHGDGMPSLPDPHVGAAVVAAITVLVFLTQLIR